MWGKRANGGRGERAVSPVIGVVLMVAIVVVLAAVIAGFAFTTFDREKNPAPAAAFTFEYDEGANELTVRMASGTDFESANVAFRQADGDSVDESPPTPDWPATVRAGDSERLGNVESDDEVRIVWSDPRSADTTAVLGRWAGPDA